ncbi:spore germination protein [Paenibacillus aurantius]|uniref:Spore germination protein n=1 Tax=Paenibacillus aurantius TaxID=2918900 RepID=A0AA96LJX0_9BACL|nr:spore germination protein [Paenibacillus aurantius]WJH32420.1 spore germination protein [Paenibacillus sp. CC-CFT747]WNQ12812.1 spore germination protein [Paenibacillus aurantius]
MASIVNIFCMKINSISNNGSVNIGESVHSDHTANTKSQGVNSSYGDGSPAESAMKNVFVDPDFNDMGDILDPTNANVVQS